MKNAESGQLHLITSKAGRDGSIAIHQDADLYLGKLDAGQGVTHTLTPGRHAWVHVAEGRSDAQWPDPHRRRRRGGQQ